jgi:Transglutaminase-like superfamily
MKCYDVAIGYSAPEGGEAGVVLVVPPDMDYQICERYGETGGGVRVWATSAGVVEQHDVQSEKPVVLRYRVTLTEERRPHTSSSQDSYLRFTSLIDNGDAVRAFAERYRRADQIETVWIMYEAIAYAATYLWPPKRRGAQWFFEELAGDCGELSGALVAACRSAGIPARIVYGAFARSVLSPHAWMEFWTLKSGWMAVDVTMANAAVRKGQGASLKPWFDFMPNDRVAFSHDCDVSLPGLLHERCATGISVQVGHHHLEWGGEVPGNVVPFMQPGYPLLRRRGSGHMTFPIWHIALPEFGSNQSG